MPVRAPALAFLLGLGGCATLDRGTLDDVQVVTDPPGASVNASTGTICISPCAVSGPRRESFVVTASKAGYVTQTATSNASPDAVATAKASAPGVTPDLVGRLVDIQDGSLYGHDPKVLVMKLERAK